jgi:signal transduction histidine kinase
MDWSEESRRLRAQLEERDDLLALVAHELRNPMHSLSMQLAAAGLEARNSGAIAAVERIKSAQSALKHYIERATLLLDLVRVNGHHTAPAEGDLAALLRRIGEGHRPLARHHGITLQFALPEACPALFDAVTVEHIVDNLLINACKHSGGSRVLLGLEQQAPDLRITVSDDGRGIPAADQDRIFGKFERGSGAANHTGTGLGLWIVQTLAERIGGSVSLEDHPKGGSVFSLRIPRHQPATTPT